SPETRSRAEPCRGAEGRAGRLLDDRPSPGAAWFRGADRGELDAPRAPRLLQLTRVRRLPGRGRASGEPRGAPRGAARGGPVRDRSAGDRGTRAFSPGQGRRGEAEFR